MVFLTWPQTFMIIGVYYRLLLYDMLGVGYKTQYKTFPF